MKDSVSSGLLRSEKSVPLEGEPRANKNGLDAIRNCIGHTVRVGRGERRTEKLEFRGWKRKLRVPKDQVLLKEQILDGR